MTHLTAFISDASEKVRDKAKEVLETLKGTLGQKGLEKLIRNTCNNKQEKKLMKYYEGGKRTSMSEAANSGSYFNKKYQMDKRNTSTTSKPFQEFTNTPSNDYTFTVIPELPLKKRISSVLKTYPKKLKT